MKIIKKITRILLKALLVGFQLWIVLSLLGVVIRWAVAPMEYFPSEGAWYCEELGLQLAFDTENDSYITVDGQRIKCICGNDKGSDFMYVLCQAPKSPYFHLGETVFGGRFVRLEGNSLTLYSSDHDAEFIFLRQDTVNSE